MITVLGVHAGRVLAGTEALLEHAELIAGGHDVLAALAPAHDGAERLVLGADLPSAIERIAAVVDGEPLPGGAGGSVVVLASGDPGFFGIVRRLAARFGAE
ncbi:MAG: bifunctional cobalt-precorrin-7 (C(5))-methyltransferase/cobalt-precorrin-6B (C(15))-methyltransferase, partial [Solirubrobacterales bacterium]|nr:bifunctional cobalt-precorrin-7 (C(5))-methyltransferase/cobalt-precorrin-6B (C(15))-methyltransferase [Solirubrobacterales bacterium]